MNQPIDRLDDYERRQDEQRAAQRRGTEAELENVSRMLSQVMLHIRAGVASQVYVLENTPGLRIWWNNRQHEEANRLAAERAIADDQRRADEAEFERLGRKLGRL